MRMLLARSNLILPLWYTVFIYFYPCACVRVQARVCVLTVGMAGARNPPYYASELHVYQLSIFHRLVLVVMGISEYVHKQAVLSSSPPQHDSNCHQLSLVMFSQAVSTPVLLRNLI